MKIALLAPFARGLSHGGSQRATAMAERLEERGAEIAWRALPEAATTAASKLAGALRGEPALVGLHAERPRPVDDAAAAIAAHSYLAAHLGAFEPSVARAIDFHNLEWRHLDDIVPSRRPLKRPYARLQSGLMRRFERRWLDRVDVAAFVSVQEMEWAAGSSAQRLLVPSVLPRAAEAEALATPRRGGGLRRARLAYVGSLDFPPNMAALLGFLAEAWPAIRAAVPGVELAVAGGCDAAGRRAIEAANGVEALGFVDELGPLLAESAAVVMPVAASAGTSLRAIYLSLAGVPVIGSPAAGRGLPWTAVTVAETPDEWARAASEAVAGDAADPDRLEPARQAALALQADPEPWDRLWESLTTKRPGRMGTSAG